MNEQTEECIQKLVDNKAQKEFMRYALLQELKSALGKLVSEAWKNSKNGGMKNKDQRSKLR